MNQDWGLPTTRPKAQLSWIMETSTSTLAGTLTVTGTNPRPQQFGGKTAFFSIWLPSTVYVIVNSGLLPSGSQSTYSSPPSP